MSGQATRIRQATVADVDIIVRHRCSMFADMGYGDEAARSAMATAARPFIEAALKDGSYRGWLVEDGDRVVAGAGLAIVGFQPTPLDPSPRRAWVPQHVHRAGLPSTRAGQGTPAEHDRLVS